METPLLLKNFPSTELHQRLAPLGVSARQARLLQLAAVRHGTFPEATANGFSARLLAEVKRIATIPHLTLVERRVSPQDGFAKYRFSGADDEHFEAVRIPLLHKVGDQKYIVCVSSQIGCALGCTFCATGRMGFRRNLAAWEIVDQVIKIQADSTHPVRGVVFMGMGEPLLNLDAVLRAAQILAEPSGLAISGKALTISTAGIVPGILRLATEHRPYKLIVSLASADPQRRRELMPVEKLHPTSDLIAALRTYHAATNQRITLAWPLLAGINTRAEDARQLATLTRDLPVQLDLIDVNDPTGRFRPPECAELDAFRDALRAHLAAPVVRRYSGGQDIHAACGMLAGAEI
ncbi:MAG: radical SAM protein [Kiritimatiellaeota bacterium]|nr:radical SAM protein [Kiritimatiellota bacterium]